MAMTAMCVFSITAVSLMISIRTANALEKAVGNTLVNLAQAKAYSVGDLLEQQLKALQSLSLSQTLRTWLEKNTASYSGSEEEIYNKIKEKDHLWSQAADTDMLVLSTTRNPAAAELLFFQYHFPIFSEIILADKYGALVAATNRTSDYYQGDEIWWQEVFSRHEGIGSAYISAPIFDDSSKTFGLRIAVPIKNGQEEFLGVMAVTYNLDNLNKLVTFSSKTPTNPQFRLLFPAEKILSADGSHLDEIPHNTLDQTNKLVEGGYARFPFQGTSCLVSTSKIVSSSENPTVDQLHWQVIAYQPENIALAPVNNQLMVIVILSLAIALLSVLLGAWFSNMITTPLRHLTDSVNQIAAGNLDITLNAKNGAEIHVLAEAFNSMTARLKETMGWLASEEARYRQLVEGSKAVVYIDRVDKSSTAEYMSPQVVDLLGYSVQEWLQDADLWLKLVHPDDLDRVQAEHKRTNMTGDEFKMEYRMIRRNGEIVWVYDHSVMLYNPDGSPLCWNGIMIDITNRKLSEEALRQNEEKFRTIIEQSSEGILLTDEKGVLLEWNRANEKMTGLKRNRVLGKPMWEVVSACIEPIDKAPNWQELLKESVLTGLKTGKSNLFGRAIEVKIFKPDGSQIQVLQTAFPIKTDLGYRIGSVSLDISDRKNAEEHIQRQMDKINSLRAIDVSITGGQDINVTLKLVLERLIKILEVDACDILVINKDRSALEYAAGKGFRTPKIYDTRLAKDEGIAWRVVSNRQNIFIPDTAEDLTKRTFSGLLAVEDFQAYIGIPLIAKDQVKGVLEVFQRKGIDPNREWMDYLESLAGQAAIALDNAQLYADLQWSNLQLMDAYESTIAGWSQALELRDKETQGHSERVTIMAVKLATEMGLSGEEMEHFRRGVFLHDIGKMGIPDSVLFKPGPLLPEEWELMRQHPVFAWKLLKDIPYLRPALDIPYAHHEKWDGSGYPRGLRGPDIPLAARIFSVVDVWDALLSDRPYRPGWDRQRVIEYIHEQSGTHFDPGVVEIFLKMIQENPEDLR